MPHTPADALLAEYSCTHCGEPVTIVALLITPSGARPHRPAHQAIPRSAPVTSDRVGSVGDPYDNAVVESFWGRMQPELLNRQRWDTRLQLANAIFEYIEGFHNRRRRHSALDYQTPVQFETPPITGHPLLTTLSR
jgi:hypothetical protein